MRPDTGSALSGAGTFSAWMLRRLLANRLGVGSLTVKTPSGMRIAHVGEKPGPDAELVLHRWRGLRRLLFNGDVGFADSYIDGDWSTPDLTAVIELAALNTEQIEVHAEGTWLARRWRKLEHVLNANTKRGARRNIQAHYDLGNDFYAAWLDRGMSYSSALFRRPDVSLEDAQTEKQNRIMSLLNIAPGMRVLDIGCGWGGLAERLARETGAAVTGITLSPSQLAAAQARVAGTGADMRLQDYRDVQGIYDRIVCIEMLEAVGAAYWPIYFDRLRDCLKPGGIAVLQVISIAEDRFETYCRRPDFIQRHIFPGGMLPTVDIMRQEIARVGLRLHSLERFGESYALTLNSWKQRFRSAWGTLRDRQFDERFRRRWEYYLSYCEAGFRAGAIDVGLYTLVRTDGGTA
jgi:cyclopropane-fatty-acyl-phospholipid synthase